MQFNMQCTDPTDPTPPPARKSESHDQGMIAPRQSTEFSQASTLVQSAMKSLGSLPEVLSKADERMRKLWDDHCMLNTLYAEAKGRIADHQRLMLSYRDHFAALEALNGHQNAEIESLEAKNEALRAKNEALHAKNEALCAKNEALCAKNEELCAKSEELQEKIRAAGAILRVT